MKAPSVRRDNLNCMRPVGTNQDNPVQKTLEQLLESGILPRADWDALEPRARLELKGHHNLDRFLLRLVDHRLLTPYQAARLQSGQKGGLILGAYRLLDRLGAGTTSVVFRGEHLETRQPVALKVLIPGQRDDDLLIRFDTERRSIAQLQHPNIVRLLDMGEAASPDPDVPLLYFYAMEFVPGHDLEAQVKQLGRLSLEQVCHLAVQMASALHCAHQHGLVHRDIKPSNILWTETGQAKLLDFGLAQAHMHRHTQPGTILGALEYIAPEQAADGANVDIRADLYALGTTLYFCLTGQPPFSAQGPLHEVLQRRATAPAPSAQYLNPEIPPRLDLLLGRLMALEPADRFQDPRELMVALEEFGGHRGDWSEASQQGKPTPSPSPATSGEGGRLLLLSPRDTAPAELDQAAEALDLLVQHVGDAAGLQGLLRRFDPDILLLDLDMPGVNDLSVVKEIQTQAPERFRKVILLADGPLPASGATYLAAGIDDVLALPTDPAALQVRLRSLIQLQNAQRRVATLAAEATSAREEPIAPLEPPPKKGGFFSWLLGKTK